MKKLPTIINTIDEYLVTNNIEYVLPEEIDEHLVNSKIFSEKQMHIYSTRRLISSFYIDYAFKVKAKWVIPHSKTKETNKGNVPKLMHYHHYRTPEQKLFYERVFNQLERNKYIEVEGNFTYVELYISKITSNFLLRKIESNRTEDFISKLTFLLEEYGQYEIIQKMISSILSDLYILLKDFNQAWKYKRISYFLEIEDVVYIKSKCSNTEINENDLLKILQSEKGLTKFGRDNIDSIKPLIKGFLNDFYEEYKTNLIDYFVKEFDFAILTDNDFGKLSNFFNNEKDFLLGKELYVKNQNSHRKYPFFYRHYLFAGRSLKYYVEREEIPFIILFALQNKIKSIIRECENTCREEQNLPRVGEGWISETYLYYSLLKAFPNEKIVHHGRPIWLNRQHLDIYFPNKNIGIEYQGEQHQSPIEYFGGEKTYIKQQQLDKKKQKLCKNNHCTLIYVYEGYDIKDIISQINIAL